MSVLTFPADRVGVPQTRIDAVAALAFADLLPVDDVMFLTEAARDPRLSSGDRLRLMGICMFVGRTRLDGWRA